MRMKFEKTEKLITRGLHVHYLELTEFPLITSRWTIKDGCV